MLKRLLTGAMIFLLGLETAVAESEKNTSLYLRQRSTFYSEPAPLDLLLNEFEGGKFPGAGNNVVTFNRIDVGFSYRAVEFGWFAREEYAFHFTSDTFKFIYMDRNEIAFADNSHFTIDLKAQHVSLQGLRLAYRVSPSDWSQIAVALNYFEARDVLLGRLSGHLALDEGEVSGELNAAYYSEKDYLFRKDVTAPDPARGHSLDVEIQLALPLDTELELTVYDLFGRLQWRQAPYTEAAVSSSTLQYDESGRLRRAPVMSGLKDYRDVEQRLPRHWWLSLRAPVGKNWALAYTAERYEEVLFNRVFLNYQLGQSLEWVGGYDFTAAAPWLGVRAGAVSLDLATDNLDLSQSRALILSASAHWRF